MGEPVEGLFEGLQVSAEMAGDRPSGKLSAASYRNALTLARRHLTPERCAMIWALERGLHVFPDMTYDKQPTWGCWRDSATLPPVGTGPTPGAACLAARTTVEGK